MFFTKVMLVHMGHGALVHPNLKKSTYMYSPNRAPLADAPIVRRSTGSGAQMLMRSIGAPLQMWSIEFFFGQNNTGAHGSWRTNTSKPMKNH